MKMKYSAQQGFTLIEITMVLFILGLLMASFLDPLAVRVEQEERNKTQIQLDVIEEILYGYVLQNHALPCPDCSDNITNDCNIVDTNDPNDINDGEEDILANTCATEVGNLPWATLGVKGTDEWDNEFTYRVDDLFADATDGTLYNAGPPVVQEDCENISATQNVSFSLCSDGDIEIFSSDDAVIAALVPNPNDPGDVATDIPAVVVSHGKNWATAASDDEVQNTDTNIYYVDKSYSQEDGEEYDDLMIWISPHILRTMTVKAGILP